MKNTVRLNFEFPKKAYPYLKLVCAEQGVSLKDFATGLLLKAIEEYEDHMLSQKARKRLKTLDPNNLVPFDEACRLAGWDDEADL